MTEALGYYEQSYPREILRGYEAPVEPPLVGGARRSSAGAGDTLVVTAGEPGTYEPELAPRDRPSNVTELRERARPADDAPWPAEAYVLIGTSGKRAHWGGDDWHSGESPGYPDEPVGAPADDDEGDDQGDDETSDDEDDDE